MNLRISALEKVARIECKYDLLFLLYSCWALPPGGSAEGQLALTTPHITFVHTWEQHAAAAAAVVQIVSCTLAAFRTPGSSANLCRSSDNK